MAPELSRDLLPDQHTLEAVMDRRTMLARTAAALGVAALATPTGAFARGALGGAIEAGPGTVNMLGWQGYDLKQARKPFEKAGGREAERDIHRE